MADTGKLESGAFLLTLEAGPTNVAQGKGYPP